jgi:hypothetical protein
MKNDQMMYAVIGSAYVLLNRGGCCKDPADSRLWVDMASC